MHHQEPLLKDGVANHFQWATRIKTYQNNPASPERQSRKRLLVLEPQTFPRYSEVGPSFQAVKAATKRQEALQSNTFCRKTRITAKNKTKKEYKGYTGANPAQTKGSVHRACGADQAQTKGRPMAKYTKESGANKG